jgi:vesicle-fusing ATPase
LKSASSFALNRQIDVKEGIKIKEGKIEVTQADFTRALAEIKPAFGVDDEEFDAYIKNGILDYGPRVSKLLQTGNLFIQQVRNSEKTPLVSVLLEGQSGSGKTALAVELARNSGFPYIKIINPESLVGFSELGKCNKITKIFEDSYKSPLSCIVVDEIERIIEYVRIGPRFSNTILQTLLVLVKKVPPKGRRLLVIATSSNKAILEDMEFIQTFDAALSVPQISTKDEFKKALEGLKAFTDPFDLNEAASTFTAPISIKKLIMVLEMAIQAQRNPDHPIPSLVDAFRQAMNFDT